MQIDCTRLPAAGLAVHPGNTYCGQRAQSRSIMQCCAGWVHESSDEWQASCHDCSMMHTAAQAMWQSLSPTACLSSLASMPLLPILVDSEACLAGLA